MSRQSVLFRQTDITRAVKGALAGGMEIGRIEIDAESRKISVFSIAMSSTALAPVSAESPYDQWKAKTDARKA